MMIYLHRVETILFFVAASRNADLALHLEAGEAPSKMLFAMDKKVEATLVKVHCRHIYDLRTNHPTTRSELKAGNILVT